MGLRKIFACLFVTIFIASCSNPDSSDETLVLDTSINNTNDNDQVNGDIDRNNDESNLLIDVDNVDETEGIEEDTNNTENAITFEEPAAKKSFPPIAYKFKEGNHFRRMTSSQGTSSSPDKIEIAEVFWYGCSHCYNFEPLLEDWKRKLPNDVSFVRIPVIWNPTNEVHARAMYTADALGVLEKAHEEIFRAIHVQNNQLSSQEGLATFFARLGIENDAFTEAYNSFGVESATKRAASLTGRYGVLSVPMLIINGKYAVDGPQSRTFNDMLNTAEELVERERRND
ncbi:MAG: thiol:disulfide interchange protein DsbA/DsbL [Pseudomonadota bacterium]|nr:thiol:disulfide interchange protein DsbA/DsbL [Pseudomonadota bacterium]